MHSKLHLQARAFAEKCAHAGSEEYRDDPPPIRAQVRQD
jgi:hypothetical protein